MTQRLYYDDSYLTDFEATVLERGEGGRLYLDRSAFYPTSGGQQFDRGSLRGAGEGGAVSAGVDVLDVVDEGERVAHVLGEADAQRFAPGERVRGQVDWARRFDHMQQHSGQHLLSAVFQQVLGLPTSSVHFGIEASTLDLDVASLGAEQVALVEERANAIVFENRPLSVDTEDAATAEGLRKQSTRSGPLRIVSIAALDRSACGGTHVTRTGEIGPILLRKLERVRKGTRVEFVCGGRATRRARADYEALSKLGGLLSTSVDSVVDSVALRLGELKRDAAALREARESLAGYRALELYAAAREKAGAGAPALHVERRPEGSLQDERGLAQAYVSNPHAVFIVALERPASILLATSEDTGLDAGATLKAALAAAGGRGGGSARLAQGTVQSEAALAEVSNALLAAIAPNGRGEVGSKTSA
jgi:alanyl-tRNA synthetase